MMTEELKLIAREAMIKAKRAADGLPPYPWAVRLICCGYYDGTELFETWEQADSFREEYCRSLFLNDHQRVGIIIRTALHSPDTEKGGTK